MALIGLTVWLYGVIVSSTGGSTYLNAVQEDSRLLCPKCNRDCDYYPLNSTYSNTYFTFWFDNFASFIYACIMPLASIIFLELWKRKQFELQYDWDLSIIQSDHHPIRPEYEERASRMGNKKIINVSTGEQEPYISKWSTIPRRAFSIVIVLIFMVVSVLRAVGLIFYR